jgi:hypothetical protein
VQVLLMILVDAFTAMNAAVHPAAPVNAAWTLLAALPAATLIWAAARERRLRTIIAAAAIAACGPVVAYAGAPADMPALAAAAAGSMISCTVACRWIMTGPAAAACWTAAAALAVFCVASGLLTASQLLLVWLSCAAAGRIARWTNVTAPRQVAHA